MMSEMASRDARVARMKHMCLRDFGAEEPQTTYNDCRNSNSFPQNLESNDIKYSRIGSN